MQAEEIKQLLQQQVDNAEVQVEVDGSHVNLVVVSPVFEGLSPVKKQQVIYGALSAQIADGTIHAVNMKTYTPDQWQQLTASP